MSVVDCFIIANSVRVCLRNTDTIDAAGVVAKKIDRSFGHVTNSLTRMNYRQLASAASSHTLHAFA